MSVKFWKKKYVKLFFDENAFENVVYKWTTILSKSLTTLKAESRHDSN